MVFLAELDQIKSLQVTNYVFDILNGVFNIYGENSNIFLSILDSITSYLYTRYNLRFDIIEAVTRHESLVYLQRYYFLQRPDLHLHFLWMRAAAYYGRLEMLKWLFLQNVENYNFNTNLDYATFANIIMVGDEEIISWMLENPYFSFYLKSNPFELEEAAIKYEHAHVLIWLKEHGNWEEDFEYRYKEKIKAIIFRRKDFFPRSFMSLQIDIE